MPSDRATWAIAIASDENNRIGLRIRRRHWYRRQGIYTHWDRNAGARDIAVKLRELADALEEMDTADAN
jgi:hypothetical protein